MNATANPTKSSTQFSLVRLSKAEYGSLSTADLRGVGSLLLTEAAQTPWPYLVIDLSAVQYFGASLVGILVSTWDELRKRGRQMVLCGLTPYCAKLILSLRLNRLFDIVPTQQDAFEKLHLAACVSGETHGPGVRLEMSDVAWGPGLVRIEYVGDDGSRIRSVIVRQPMETPTAS